MTMVLSPEKKAPPKKNSDRHDASADDDQVDSAPAAPAGADAD
jgi:hypothetical protein